MITESIFRLKSTTYAVCDLVAVKRNHQYCACQDDKYLYLSCLHDPLTSILASLNNLHDNIKKLRLSNLELAIDSKHVNRVDSTYLSASSRRSISCDISVSV